MLNASIVVHTDGTVLSGIGHDKTLAPVFILKKWPDTIIKSVKWWSLGISCMGRVNPTIRYSLAIAAACVAILLRNFLTPLLGIENPYHTVWLAVVFSAWLFGLGPSIVTSLMSAIGVWLFLLPPFYSLTGHDRTQVFGMFSFLTLSALIIALGESNRRGATTLSRLAAIVESSGDAIVSKNLDGIITSWNKSAERLFGYKADEVISKHITILIPEERRSEEDTILARLKSGLQIDHFETVRVRKDGAFIDVSITISPVKDAEGRVVGASKVARDITERQKNERALRASEERFRAIVETTPECVKLVSADGTLLHMNASGLSMLGAESAETVVGKSVYDLIAPGDRERYRLFNQNICGGERGSLEFDIVGIRGALRRMETHSAPLRHSDGSIVHLSVTRDISDRKQAEITQRRLAAIIDSTDDAVVSKDLNGIITSWNPGAERIFGFNSREAIGRPISIIIPADLKDEEEQIITRLRKGERFDHYETVRMHKNGRRLQVSVTISPIRDTQGQVVGASKIARDITERNRIQETLRESELSARLLQLQDEERRRIARDLHDGVGQLIAAMSMNAGILEKEKSNLSPAAARSVDENAILIDQISRDIRTVSHLLHPPLLDEMGLRSALQWYVDGFAERSKIAARFEMSNHAERLPHEYELCLFRIAQECLTNVHRHSGSFTVEIRLLQTADEIKLEVRDAGKGIDPEVRSKISAGEGVGVGFRGMQERLRLLGGNLHVDSNGKGTVIVATLPISKPS